MKGLLIKDLKLMKNQMWFFIMIIGISIACAASLENSFFAMGYATSFISIFSVSTISYDEYDNGMPYLFALPISRKIYVKEKYLYAVLTSIVALAIAIVISAGTAMLMDMQYPMSEWLGIISFSLFLVSLIIAVMLPVRMKYDAEKNKMAMFVAVGVILLTCAAIFKIADLLHVDFLAFFDELIYGSPVKMLLFVLVAGVVMIWISYIISVKIMEKREF